MGTKEVRVELIGVDAVSLTVSFGSVRLSALVGTRTTIWSAGVFAGTTIVAAFVSGSTPPPSPWTKRCDWPAKGRTCA